MRRFIDLATIRDAKLPVITPVIVTNTADFDDVLTTKEARVNTGDYLLTAVKKETENQLLGFLFI